MSERNLFILLGIAAVILSLLLLSYSEDVPSDVLKEPIHVAAVDINGCVISTGYVWSEDKGYCVEPSSLVIEEDNLCGDEERFVCGINGKTYKNPCLAGITKIVRFGPC